jgi:hypothetical protein
VKRIFIAAALALTSIGAHAGVLATDGFSKGDVTVQIALTDTRCKGGGPTYDKDAAVPISGVATIMSSGGHKQTGCWTAPLGSQEVEVQWADGLVGRYPMLELQVTNYGVNHGM